jgi:hypothetical protein
LTPNRDEAAPLRLIYTEFPSGEVEAGVFFQSAFPSCGCDACDEEWSIVADRLENIVFAVVKGSFCEVFHLRSISTGMWWPDGSEESACRVRDLPYSKPYIAKASWTLRALKDGWQSWPKRDQ